MDLLEHVERLRLEAGLLSASEHKAALGQFFTPAAVARKMAGLLQCPGDDVSLLDAGAGVGILFASCVAQLCRRAQPPRQIRVTAYEIDARLTSYLHRTIDLCRAECAKVGTEFQAEVIGCDFIQSAAQSLGKDIFSAETSRRYDCAILNPPYRKIHSQSPHRKWLRQMGVETSNLYTGFLAAAMRLLKPNGEMVAITPRSFCNGPYFKPFRRDLLNTMALDYLHVYEARDTAFRDDNVLQENIIFHAMKGRVPPEQVVVSRSAGPNDEQETRRRVPYEAVVSSRDPQSFIHLPVHDKDDIAKKMQRLPCTLGGLGLAVSTGRVVDFRARASLSLEMEADCAPLIYPTHLSRGAVTWPQGRTRKPCALTVSDAIAPQLIPNANYVLVKRFSTKEEAKRIVATVYEAGTVPGLRIGLENHLNYFHAHGQGLSLSLARGLAAFLNSSLVDSYFRQFNGHTQVNATDLRSFHYPTEQQLIAIGNNMDGTLSL